jgi:hypothetical protein
MKVVAFGVEPVGFLAIGANATGVIAVGQLATGIVAVGQLARGVVAVGQLAIGWAALGQLAIGVSWAAGMLGIAGHSGRGMLAVGPLRRGVTPWRIVLLLVLIALWWFVVGTWLLDAITREGGIFVDAPRPLR